MDAPDVALAEAELLTTADMARIAVSEVERVSFRKAIGQMLSYFDQMSAVDVSGVTPTTHAPAAATRPPLRSDRATPSASRWGRATEQALLSRAGDTEDGFVTTPNVL